MRPDRTKHLAEAVHQSPHKLSTSVRRRKFHSQASLADRHAYCKWELLVGTRGSRANLDSLHRDAETVVFTGSSFSPCLLRGEERQARTLTECGAGFEDNGQSTTRRPLSHHGQNAHSSLASLLFLRRRNDDQRSGRGDRTERRCLRHDIGAVERDLPRQRPV